MMFCHVQIYIKISREFSFLNILNFTDKNFIKFSTFKIPSKHGKTNELFYLLPNTINHMELINNDWCEWNSSNDRHFHTMYSHWRARYTRNGWSRSEEIEMKRAITETKVGAKTSKDFFPRRKRGENFGERKGRKSVDGMW